MPRLGQIVLLVLLTLVGSGEWASAQWAVEDAANLVQNTTTAFNSVKQVYNSSQQLIAEYNIFRSTVTQIENQVKNLQRIPKGLNLFDTLLAYGNRIDALLSQTNTLSFELDQAVRDFDQLYRQAAQLTSAHNALQLRQQLLNARLEASGMAVKMQSVRTNLADLYNRIAALLNGSWTAVGNLDSQQIAAQQQALLLHSQREAQAMIAAAQRLEAQRQAEDVVLQQAAIQSYLKATTLAPVGDWQNGPQLEMKVRGSLR
jgi:P-type conjugative transfer protein TrbJ